MQKKFREISLQSVSQTNAKISRKNNHDWTYVGNLCIQNIAPHPYFLLSLPSISQKCSRLFRETAARDTILILRGIYFNLTWRPSDTPSDFF